MTGYKAASPRQKDRHHPNDLPNFATGGVTIFISEVDSYLAPSNLQLPVSQLRQPVVPLYGRPAVIKTPKWLNCKPVMKE